MNYYYADHENQTMGPVTMDQLEELFQSGDIGLDSYVIAEGESDWDYYRAIRVVAPPPQRLLVPLKQPPTLTRMEPTTITMVPQSNTKKCPFCAEDVNFAAKKCKHCGETLDVAMRAAEENKRSASQQPMVFMNSSSAAVAVTDSKKRFPHLIHLILTLLTGVWLFVWIFHYIFRDRRKYG